MPQRIRVSWTSRAKRRNTPRTHSSQDRDNHVGVVISVEGRRYQVNTSPIGVDDEGSQGEGSLITIICERVLRSSRRQGWRIPLRGYPRSSAEDTSGSTKPLTIVGMRYWTLSLKAFSSHQLRWTRSKTRMVRALHERDSGQPILSLLRQVVRSGDRGFVTLVQVKTC